MNLQLLKVRLGEKIANVEDAVVVEGLGVFGAAAGGLHRPGHTGGAARMKGLA